VWKSLTPEQQKACIETLTQQEARTFEQAFSSGAAVIDEQFPSEIAEEIKAAVSYTLPLLADALRGNQEAKLSFYHKGTKSKLQLEQKEDGSFELRCIGGKLGEGTTAMVLKMAGINIPKNLQEANEGWTGVYYAPMKKDFETK
jgi:hypothetical protein